MKQELDRRFASRHGRVMLVLAALCGAAGVALGAFGAHALRPVLAELNTLDTWRTASLYHLLHSVVLLCLALAWPRARLGFWLVFSGIVLFSGSLYAFSLTGERAFTPLTPVGGLCLLGGWLALAVSAGRSVRNSDGQSC